MCLKYIREAMERLKNLPEDSERELTVLEKLLIRDSNYRTAMVMALDMMTAGIDTVCKCNQWRLQRNNVTIRNK